MSVAGAGAVLGVPVHLLRRLHRAVARGGRWFYPYRPRVRDRRFWAVQVLVLLIAGAHTVLEVVPGLKGAPLLAPGPLGSFESFLPVSLFFVPVVYAALNFGLAGSLATAAWCTVLTIPNVTMHPGFDRIHEASQLGILNAIAAFVGQRVNRELTARHQAESANTALRASEAKYHSLFQSSPAPVLLLDTRGVILEGNAAASDLFERPPENLRGLPLATFVGTPSAERLWGTPGTGEDRAMSLVVKRQDGAEVYVQPALTRVSDSRRESVMQVLLRDVTQERHRQAGLRAYAARILRAQEEERQRVAHELHDESLQALVVLCRRLDAVESGDEALPTGVISLLHEARESAEEVMAGLRGFARALRPPILDDLGLPASMHRLSTDLNSRISIEAHVVIAGLQRRLSAETELGLFRIAQEALRNVERHADASGVDVSLAFGDREVRLDVADNGKGFILPDSPGDFATAGHLGLLGMQERAELIGGHFDIQSSVGTGTKVTVVVPG